MRLSKIPDWVFYIGIPITTVVACVVLLVAAAYAPPAYSPPAPKSEQIVNAVRPITIAGDLGGLVPQAEEWYQRIRNSGVPVRLSGECDSACTLILMLPKTQVCVENGAVLGFHQVRASLEEKVGNPKLTAWLIKRYYPQAVQDWLAKQPPLTLEMTYMLASDIVRLGVFPHC